MLRTGVNEVEGVPVEVSRKRIRRINLRVTDEGVVKMSIPRFWATLAEGEAFLRRMWPWVLKTRAKALARPKVDAHPVGEAERQALHALLAELNAVWAERLGEADVTWRIRPFKSIWGSCNWRRRTISYNLELARVPRELVEYVVVHEYTHFREHGHGPSFRARMDARLPGWTALRRRLNGRGRPASSLETDSEETKGS